MSNLASFFVIHQRRGTPRLFFVNCGFNRCNILFAIISKITYFFVSLSLNKLYAFL